MERTTDYQHYVLSSNFPLCIYDFDSQATTLERLHAALVSEAQAGLQQDNSVAQDHGPEDKEGFALQ